VPNVRHTLKPQVGGRSNLCPEWRHGKDWREGDSTPLTSGTLPVQLLPQPLSHYSHLLTLSKFLFKWYLWESPSLVSPETKSFSNTYPALLSFLMCTFHEMMSYSYSTYFIVIIDYSTLVFCILVILHESRISVSASLATGTFQELKSEFKNIG
jgi:hypothetical protein